jgi:hypothetical protein
VKIPVHAGVETDLPVPGPVPTGFVPAEKTGKTKMVKTFVSGLRFKLGIFEKLRERSIQWRP